jgi:hypothetical protein
MWRSRLHPCPRTSKALAPIDGGTILQKRKMTTGIGNPTRSKLRHARMTILEEASRI